jgi:hypothetical protein
MLLAIVVLCFSLTIWGQNSSTTPIRAPHVDERVELLSIVFRLAGTSEFNTNALPLYSSRIDKYFSPYSKHPAVLMAKKLVQTKQMGADDVMVLALALTEPPDINLRQLSSPDEKWTEEDLEQFLPLLIHFYRDTEFEKFYQSNKPIYDAADAHFAELLTKVNFSWISQFYGENPGITLHIVLGLNNGTNNYEFRMQHEDKSLHQYSIIGCWTSDGDGAPSYTPETDYLTIIVRDVHNSYIVPEVESAWRTMGTAPEVIFRAESESMQTLGVSDAKAMIEESLLRSALILSNEQSGDDERKVLHRVREEQGNGFDWMDKQVDLLHFYSQNRLVYPSFKKYFPQFVTFYMNLAPKIDAVKSDFAKKSVHVARVEPMVNGAANVDPTLKSITVTFDKQLNMAKNFSFNGSADAEIKFPISGRPTYTNGGTSIMIPINLEPASHYAFDLTSDILESSDGYPLKTYHVDFKTR